MQQVESKYHDKEVPGVTDRACEVDLPESRYGWSCCKKGLNISHGKFKRGVFKGLFSSSSSRSTNRLECSVLAGRLLRL